MAARRATRARGRPPAGATTLTREDILRTALALLEEEGLAGASMRALARRLGADPMALYHYFPSKDALLADAAAWAYAEMRLPTAQPDDDVRGRLLALARAYVRFLERAGELARFVAAHPAIAESAGGRLDAAFDDAIAPLGLDDATRRAALGAFVDLLHGYALAGGRAPDRHLRAELELLFLGIEARAQR